MNISQEEQSRELLPRIKKQLALLLSEPVPGEGAKVLTAIRELDALLAENESLLDSRLAHFLARRSYAKASDYLAALELDNPIPPPPPTGRGN